MKIVYPSYEILNSYPTQDRIRMVEGARTCYKSEREETDEERADFIRRCVERGHHSILEHSSLTVKFICDRGVSHELVRHRLAGYSQESTRYCNYSKSKFGHEITVVKPTKIKENTLEYDLWESGCLSAERAYFSLLDAGVKPENARAVLPTCLKTEIVVTANLREWLHILDLRTSHEAHPDIRYLMIELLAELAHHFQYPEIFENLANERIPLWIKDNS